MGGVPLKIHQNLYLYPKSAQKKIFGNLYCRFRDIWILLEVIFSDRAKSQNLKRVFGEIEAPTFGKSRFYKGKKKKLGALTRHYDLLWPQKLVLWILLGQETTFEFFAFLKKKLLKKSLGRFKVLTPPK